MKTFNRPSFADGQIEVRYCDKEMCIYGTASGLERLIQLIRDLISTNQDQESAHIHVEDFDLLTKSSLKCVVALFNESKSA